MKQRHFLFATLIFLAACAGPQIKDEPEEKVETVTHEIVPEAPADHAEWTLSAEESYTFSWATVPSQNNYKLLLSRSENLSNPYVINTRGGAQTISGKTLDGYLQELGIASEQTATLWWSVLPFTEVKNTVYKTYVRQLTVTRLADEKEDWGPVTEPYVVKVAVVYEDPYYTNRANASDPNNGKRIHEIEGWNDPRKQVLEYAADFEKYSHGAVKIEIVEEHDVTDRLFVYYHDPSDKSFDPEHKVYVTPENVVHECFDDRKNIDGIGLDYDYVAMMDELGITGRVDAGEVNEVWVYNHPACRMNESRFMGQGGFWCNSGPILYGSGPDDAHNKKLVCVMFCNYERTVDLALHSFAHRVESIMSQLYYGQSFHWFPNDANFSGLKRDLRTFDRFFSHGSAYDKVGESGYAHIGTCHSPCNTDVDYGYSETTYVNSYVDEWDEYPRIRDDKEKARRINSTEWRSSQYGYMEFFFSHIPHFKGLNTYDPDDLHLNNWWHYLFDYYGAKEYEARLQREIY